MVKHFKIFFLGTSKLILMKLGMKHQRLKSILFCSMDNLGLTLTNFRARSNFSTFASLWENVTIMDSLETISSCDVDFGLYSKLND